MTMLTLPMTMMTQIIIWPFRCQFGPTTRRRWKHFLLQQQQPKFTSFYLLLNVMKSKSVLSSHPISSCTEEWHQSGVRSLPCFRSNWLVSLKPRSRRLHRTELNWTELELVGSVYLPLFLLFIKWQMQYEHPFSIFTENGKIKNGLQQS